jgi:predicted urease superfamily metal-dependent hydrolase
MFILILCQKWDEAGAKVEKGKIGGVGAIGYDHSRKNYRYIRVWSFTIDVLKKYLCEAHEVINIINTMYGKECK